MGGYFLVGLGCLIAGFIIRDWYKGGQPAEKLKASTEENPVLYYYRSCIGDNVHYIHCKATKKNIFWQSKNKVRLRYGDTFFIDKDQNVVRYYKMVSNIIQLKQNR